MDLEEQRQDVAIARPRRVEDDLDRLRMAWVVAVGRVFVLPARVPDAGFEDAGPAADQVLHAPEAPARQNGCLRSRDLRDLPAVVGPAGHAVAPFVESWSVSNSALNWP